jgi:hypothetical protein
MFPVTTERQGYSSKIPASLLEKTFLTRQSYPTPPPLGARVRRGPQWKWGDQDGQGVGTVVKHSDTKGK